MSDRKFLFDYRHEGETYCVDIVARDPVEAKAKLQAMSWATYQGEIFATIPIPGGRWLAKLFGWGKS